MVGHNRYLPFRLHFDVEIAFKTNYCGFELTVLRNILVLPVQNSLEVDKYVVFNYQNKQYGVLGRTAWLDGSSGTDSAGTDSFLYNHELEMMTAQHLLLRR